MRLDALHTMNRKRVLVVLVCSICICYYIVELEPFKSNVRVVFDKQPIDSEVVDVPSVTPSAKAYVTNKMRITARSKYKTKVKSRLDNSPEDLMKVAPLTFLPNYKNPCWADEQRSPPISCLPYFYLAGFPKAGTTDVYRRLTMHPDVSQYCRKEPHWLPRSHFYKTRSGYWPKFSQYVNIYSATIRLIYGKADTSGFHNMIYGDGSASTLWDQFYWTLLPENENRTEPLHTNADYIHHLNPNTKIIVMLRDPVERTYSDYLYFAHGEKSPKIFHNTVVKLLNFTKHCSDKHSLRHCTYMETPEYRNVRVRLYIGLYHVHIADYLRVFPRKQILIVKLEEYSKNIAGYMERMFNFLELRPLTVSKMESVAKSIAFNTRRKKDLSVRPMLDSTRKLLEEYYRPHNEKLSELLGQEFNYNK